MSSGLLEWIIFLPLALIAIVTAAGMIITMSMYRAGLALMASFVALAGIFILLDADLLAAIQVMMNVGGMLAMVLFMVMIMMDPGGEMMWGMKRDMHMPGPGAFSMHMPSGPPPPEDEPQEHQQQDDAPQTYTCSMHPDIQQDTPGTCPKCGMTLIPQKSAEQSDSQMDTSGHGMSDMSMDDHDMGDMNMGGMTPRQNYDMMVDMAMSTAQLPWAIVLGVVSAILLIVLLILTPWPLAGAVKIQDASRVVGELLLSRYMIAFEGAALLILAGIAGAVLLAKREETPDNQPHTVQPEQGDEEKRIFTCPMHPEVRQQGPGTCPKCGMTLIPAQETTAATSQNGGQS
jgi:NADH-quinone oxidoreductase subunit J